MSLAYGDWMDMDLNDLAAHGFKVYPGAVLTPSRPPVPDFAPINVEELSEVKVVQNHTLSPFCQLDKNGQLQSLEPYESSLRPVIPLARIIVRSVALPRGLQISTPRGSTRSRSEIPITTLRGS